MSNAADLSGKTIVVTGGNTGIGAAICLAAGAAGANVVIDYIANEEGNAALISEIEQSGGKAVAIKADVTQLDQVQSLVDTAVNDFGALDIWVNCAGMEIFESILEVDEATYDKTLAVNLKGSFFGAKFAAQQFIKQGHGGVIINISSVHEDWPMPGNAAYCVSKGGMRMLTRNTAVELAEHAIRVVGVAPGAIKTPMNAPTLDSPELKAALEAAIPMKRIGDAVEIARLVTFLASDQASYITATTVVADGGMMQFSPGL